MQVAPSKEEFVGGMEGKTLRPQVLVPVGLHEKKLTMRSLCKHGYLLSVYELCPSIPLRYSLIISWHILKCSEAKKDVLTLTKTIVYRLGWGKKSGAELAAMAGQR
jgi:hypothetical protein